MDKPYISFVASGRRDGHCGDFVYRLNNSLRTLDYYSRIYGLGLEYIIVEWNPLNGKLLDVLFRPTYIKIRILTVNDEIHNAVPKTRFDALKADKMTFFQGIAQNVGFRRAKGDYILSTNGDIIFSDILLKILAERALKKDELYRIYRFDVRREIPSSLVYNEIVGFCGNESDMRGQIVDGNSPYVKAAGDFILAHRNTFNKVRGFPEIRCDGLKIDGDIVTDMCMVARQLIFSREVKIFHQFHMNRYEEAYDRQNHVRVNATRTVSTVKVDERLNKRIFTDLVNRNDDDWGLHNFELPEVTLCKE